jgi:hypothetical protein
MNQTLLARLAKIWKREGALPARKEVCGLCSNSFVVLQLTVSYSSWRWPASQICS